MDVRQGVARLSSMRAEILSLAARYGAHNIRVFGSSVQLGASAARDVDILVAFDLGRSLLDQVCLWQDLEDLLGCKVDLVSERGLSPYLRDRILAEAKEL